MHPTIDDIEKTVCNVLKRKTSSSSRREESMPQELLPAIEEQANLAFASQSLPSGLLCPEESNEYKSIKSVLEYAGMPTDYYCLDFVMNNSPIRMADPVQLTMAQIIAFCRDLRSNGNSYPFFLSSETLFSLVEQIDMLPNMLGFHYPDALRRECQFLVPRPIDERMPISQVTIPLQRFLQNQQHLHCPRMLGTGLLLSLLHRFLRGNEKLTKADWTPLVRTVESPNRYEPLAFILNETVDALTP